MTSLSFFLRQTKKRRGLPLERKNLVYSSIILTLPFLSEAQRRQDIVNIMLILLITLLYCLIFFFVIPENISTFLTLIALVLLTIYWLSAISSLLVFSSTHKLDSIIGDSTERLVAFLTVQHMLCFILEILDCYDYLVHITLLSSCAYSEKFCYYGIDRQYFSSHILATENLAIPSDWAKKPNVLSS